MLAFALCLLLNQAPAPTPAPAPAAAPHLLLQIKTVYIVSMSNAFDQYLANRIARKGALEVVTDPLKADAILTDRLGASFETTLARLYPEPKPEPAPKPKKDDKDEDEDKPAGALDVKSQPFERPVSSGRSRGNVFLVHRGSRSVVWSSYARPKNIQADTLDSTARDLAAQLSSAIHTQAKSAGLTK